MRRPLLLALLLAAGCRAAPPPADDERIRELEARVAWLEAEVRAATLLEDEILALEVERAGMLVSYEAGHPAIVDVERKIRAVEKVRVLDEHARREAMLRRLETEREHLLDRYTPDHPSVRTLDAKIAFLKG